MSHLAYDNTVGTIYATSLEQRKGTLLNVICSKITKCFIPAPAVPKITVST